MPVINPITNTDPMITISVDRITPCSSCHKQLARRFIERYSQKASDRFPQQITAFRQHDWPSIAGARGDRRRANQIARKNSVRVISE
jgi:hypothetical protein